MKHRTPVVLYFSTDKRRVDLFWRIVDYNGLNYNDNGLFLSERPKHGFFRHAAELPLFLQQYKGELQSLHIIVDLNPFSLNSESRDDLERFPVEYIRDCVISYPEVQFLFDQHDLVRDKDSLILFLFADRPKVERQYKKSFPVREWEETIHKFYASFVLFDWESLSGKDLKDAFYSLIAGRDNTFDFSNLRYVIKRWKEISLKVASRNFSLIQDSRSENLVICVEEEANQNVFNSYALFKNGFRVLPITSAAELRWINDKIDSILNSSFSNVLVFRDFDLQFEDEGEHVNQIRGYKHYDEKEYDRLKASQKRVLNIGWNDFRIKDHLGRANQYWQHLREFKTFFITKGPSESSISTPITGEEQTAISEDCSLLSIVGLRKPISGLYTPFQFGAIKERFDNTRQYEALMTSRSEHNHSTPLDIYDMINLMIRRAEYYYEKRKYRLAALVSGEAIEIMNGFHQRLLIKAHFINFKSENAIAMDVIGGDERYLCKDTAFRIEMIQKDVERLFCGSNDLKYSNQSINILNQIYNDCRSFCHQHEHFEAEEAFISAMGHLNEGFPPSKIKLSALGAISRIKESIEELHKHFTNRFDEQLKSLIDRINDVIKKEDASIYLGRGIYIYTKKQSLQLNKHKRRYKRLSGKAWRRTGFHIIQHQVELGLNTKKKLVQKHHRLSLFERIKWESADSSIASFRGGSICANNTGETTLIAKMNNTCLASIKIVVRSNKENENVKTSNKG